MRTASLWERRPSLGSGRVLGHLPQGDQWERTGCLQDRFRPHSPRILYLFNFFFFSLIPKKNSKPCHKSNAQRGSQGKRSWRSFATPPLQFGVQPSTVPFVLTPVVCGGVANPIPGRRLFARGALRAGENPQDLPPRSQEGNLSGPRRLVGMNSVLLSPWPLPGYLGLIPRPACPGRSS